MPLLMCISPLLTALEESCGAQLLACVLEVLRSSEGSAAPPDVKDICVRVVASCGAVAALSMQDMLVG